MSFKKRGFRSRTSETFRVTEEITPLAIEKFLCSLNCPRALTVWLLFKNSEHRQLAELECDPSVYEGPHQFRDAYAATKFLSKFKGLTLDYDLDEVAMLKFEKFELQCKRQNEVFKDLSSHPKFRGEIVWLHNAIIRKIESILGDFDVHEFFSSPDWGPGATTKLKASVANASNKFRLENGITRDLYDLIPLGTLAEVYPAWAYHLSRSGFQFEKGNRVVTVAKDSRANRVIAIEPGLNLWFQKSIGTMIERRLRRCGIDLRYQDRNQKLAERSSVTDLNATIDFSSASDSISIGTVEALLPPRWFSILDAARSHFGTRSDGSVVKWNKFSSMGNGFTFPLESLIFYAIAFCCARYSQPLAFGEAVSVYGDDVIIPSRCFDLFREVSEFYGFSFNAQKSFRASPFRESCGSHFFNGVDVKPIYLKDRLSSFLTVYRLANQVRRFAHREIFCDAKFRACFDYLVALVPKVLRLRIPEGFGDGGFISNFDEATPQRARHCIEGYFVVTAVERSMRFNDESVGVLFDRLWSTSVESKRNTVTFRGRTKIRFSRILVPQWYDLGPWF